MEYTLSKEIYTGKWHGGHIQGIAVDKDRRYMYCSFTTEFVKLDMQGNVIGSVKGFTGHLGCMAYNEADGRVYCSLEYKNDAIGSSILQRLGMNEEIQNAFYIAIFDVDKIDRLDMDFTENGVMKTVWLREATEDYLAEWEEDGKTVTHRHGASGIDGITFAPAFEGEGMRLLVAYGIYGDTEREDNDYQVLLSYRPEDLVPYEAVLSADNIHKSGPEKADAKYFVFTGNTNWGVQNMEYDPATGNIFLAVYPGRKQQYPNYKMFVIDGQKAPKEELLRGYKNGETGKVLSLVEKEDGILGSYFRYGSTGMIALGGGMFYFSEDHNGEGYWDSMIRLYRYTGEGRLFEKIE